LRNQFHFGGIVVSSFNNKNQPAIQQCFSLTTNQRIVLSVMAYQPSEQGHNPFKSKWELIFIPSLKQPLGDLGTLEAGENGEAHLSGPKEKLRVVDLIGRSIALYATEDRSGPGIAAAVIARSAGVGENYKKLCTCDGVTIWESS
jgi:hypothetical protein